MNELKIEIQGINTRRANAELKKHGIKGRFITKNARLGYENRNICPSEYCFDINFWENIIFDISTGKIAQKNKGNGKSVIIDTLLASSNNLRGIIVCIEQFFYAKDAISLRPSNSGDVKGYFVDISGKEMKDYYVKVQKDRLHFVRLGNV